MIEFNDNEEIIYLWEMAKSVIKDKTLITDEMMETWKRERRDKYFTNEELLELNIVDEIL
jgi:hypothetical protein